MPSFLALQLLVDRWAIGGVPASTANGTDLDGLDVSALAALASRALQQIGDNDTAAALWNAAWNSSVAAAGGVATSAALAGPLQEWLAGELLPPQSVRTIPFPAPPAPTSGQFYTYQGRVVYLLPLLLLGACCVRVA
jgi:hypothetical protein